MEKKRNPDKNDGGGGQHRRRGVEEYGKPHGGEQEIRHRIAEPVTDE